MSRIAVVLALCLSSPSPAADQPPAPSASVDLGILTGDWIMEENGRVTTETWDIPTAGRIAGSSKSGKRGKTDFTETMRIGPDREGRVTLWVGTQNGKDQTPFHLIKSDSQTLDFENRTHDYPQFIRYFRSGGILSASIMNIGGEKAQYYRYRPANPPKPSAQNPVPDLSEVEANLTFARSCFDDTGFVLCEPPTRIRVRNLLCWPMESVATYIEPYRSSPAAECVFESVTEPLMRISQAMRALARPSDKPPPVRWRSDWARLHYLAEGDCTGAACPRSWYMPRD